jgi:hypothetical protein
VLGELSEKYGFSSTKEMTHLAIFGSGGTTPVPHFLENDTFPTPKPYMAYHLHF